jgi:hypothetical protein
MELVNRSLQVFIFSNSWIAIGAGCITYYFSTHCLSSFHHSSFLYAVFVTTLTFTSYNFQRLLKQRNNEKPISIRHFWINEHIILLKILTLIGSVISVILAYNLLTYRVVLYSIPMIIFVLFYAQVSPFFKGIRSILLLKNIITALVWTYTVLIVPIILNEPLFSFVEVFLKYKMEIFALFLFIFGVSIPFDIRDKEQDQGKIKTFVGLIGVTASKWISLGCFSISGYLVFILEWYTVQISLLIALVLLWFTNSNRSEWFYSFFWDGILVFFGLGILIENLL